MVYETSDTYFAAFLLVAEVKMSHTRLDTGDGRVYFIFEHPGVPVIRDLKHAYFSGSGTVSALSLVQNLRHLKRLVSDLRRQ